MTLRILTQLPLFLVALGVGPSQAFNIFPKPVQNLIGMANSIQQKKESLDISLNIGDGKNGAFGLHGLELGLETGDAAGVMKMPGANGPHPSLSSGLKALRVKAQGWFTSMMGRKTVDIQDGAWELVWKDGAPAGALICGVNVAQEAAQNGAKLPAGKLYMSFPVWTIEGLANQRARMAAVQTRAKEFLDARDDELSKMKETNNILAKAMHYRNAWHAVEQFSLTGLKEIERQTPDEADIVQVNDLLLTKKGTIWTKSMNRNKLVGSAQVNAKDVVDNKE